MALPRRRVDFVVTAEGTGAVRVLAWERGAGAFGATVASTALAPFVGTAGELIGRHMFIEPPNVATLAPGTGDTASAVSGSAAFATNATLTNGKPNAVSWTITPS